MAKYDSWHPWVVFSLDGEEYCANSAYVQAILSATDEMTRMPNNPANLIGVAPYAGGHIPVFDARTMFGLETLKQEIEDFGIMRQMHLDWVEALRDSVENHTPFSKPVNPHKCKFGLWYDDFHTNNVSINFILGKIDEPHTAIHACGAEAQKLMARGDFEGAKEQYKKAEKICRESVIPLLDQLIRTYQEVNRGMILVLQQDEGPVGLMVDEISRLAQPARVRIVPVPPGTDQSEFIADVVLDDDRMLSNVDVPSFFQFINSNGSYVKQALALASK